MSEGLNQYVVYRLKRALRETRTRRHQSYQYLQKYQMEVISDLYDQIYLSEFDPSLSPLQLRRQLEKELPADSAGETLAISDVLAITRYGITSAYYVDPDKLVSLTGFFHVPSSRELLTPETTDFQIPLISRLKGAREPGSLLKISGSTGIISFSCRTSSSAGKPPAQFWTAADIPPQRTRQMAFQMQSSNKSGSISTDRKVKTRILSQTNHRN